MLEIDGCKRRPFFNGAKLLKWSTLELLNRDTRVLTNEGHNLLTPARNFSSLAVFLTGQRDADIQAFIRKNLRSGGCFLDIGANVGIYTLFASKIVGSSGKVLSIEANPTTFHYLQKNISDNQIRNACAVNVAVGESSGQLQIAANAQNAGETHVASPTEDGVIIPVDPIDLLVERNGIRQVDYIKIDVEGFELPALRGAQDVISDNRDIVIQTEVVEAHCARYGYAVQDVVKFLTSHGLKPFAPDAQGTGFPCLSAISAAHGTVCGCATD